MEKTKYLLVFVGGAWGTTPDEIEKINASWGAWYGSIGADLVDYGSAVGDPVKVSGDTVEEGKTDTKVGGFVVVQAESKEQAIAYAKSSPIVADGGSVEVLRYFAM